MQYKDISLGEFLELAKTHRIVIFGTGKLFQRAMEKFASYGMNPDCIRVIMDNGHAGTDVVACGRPWQVQSVEDGVRAIESDDIILITPYTYFAEMSEQLESYGLSNICCLYSLFDVWAMREQGARERYPMRRTEQPMIPKVIHYFWFGTKEIPDDQKKCIESWHRYCPDYEFHLWNEENYDIHKCKYMEDAYASGRMGFVPDYARIDLLYQVGGVYLDTDVELLRPIDDLLYQPAFCCMQSNGVANLGSGFGCVPGLEIIREMRDEYLTAEFILADGTYNLQMSSPQYQTRTLERYGFHPDNTYQIIEDMTVYPADVLCGACLNGKRETTQNSYALHLPSLSWADQERIDAEQQTLQAIREKFS